MQMLIEFLPIVLFFVAFKLKGIFLATLVAILASLAQVGWGFYKGQKPQAINLITLAMIVILGSLTLYLENEMFIKWKPTGVYWALSIVFIISQYGFKANLIEKMLSKNISLENAVWTRLNLAWSSFFALMGIINLFVVYNFDTDTWVNFKLFGTLALTLVFMLGQGIYLSKYLKESS